MKTSGEVTKKKKEKIIQPETLASPGFKTARTKQTAEGIGGGFEHKLNYRTRTRIF